METMYTVSLYVLKYWQRRIRRLSENNIDICRTLKTVIDNETT